MQTHVEYYRYCIFLARLRLEITQIKKTGICYQNWPGSEQCVEVTFAVPLQYVADDEEDLETRLTEQDLQDMWEMYSRIDPFAVRLEQLGVVEFTYPNERSVVTVWLVLAAGVVISMAMLAFALWRFSCFEEYTKMPSYSDTDSLNDKRVLDLYPTPHQTLPPLYTEDFNWADDKYDITKDHGYSNNSYLRDDMFDIDSDEDTLRTQNGSFTIYDLSFQEVHHRRVAVCHRYRPEAISPRDIYHV
ncbi:unnamed protein product [Colias eurytheme]|nr:unnamed protein product [Colias eurytheme]